MVQTPHPLPSVTLTSLAPTSMNSNLVYLAKVPTLAMIMAAEYISFWPPNPAPKEADRRKFDSAFYATLIYWFPPLGVVCSFTCFTTTWSLGANAVVPHANRQ